MRTRIAEIGAIVAAVVAAALIAGTGESVVRAQEPGVSTDTKLKYHKGDHPRLWVSNGRLTKIAEPCAPSGSMHPEVAGRWKGSTWWKRAGSPLRASSAGPAIGSKSTTSDCCTTSPREVSPARKATERNTLISPPTRTKPLSGSTTWWSPPTTPAPCCRLSEAERITNQGDGPAPNTSKKTRSLK